MAFQGFEKSSGPSEPPKSLNPFAHFPRPPSPTPSFSGDPFIQWNSLSPPRRDNRPHEDVPSLSTYLVSYDSGQTSLTKLPAVQSTKRARSPPLPSANEVLQKNSHLQQNESTRPSLSPHRLGTRTNDVFSNPESQIPQRPSLSSNNGDGTATTKLSSFPVTKRTRSPPLTSSNQVVSPEDGAERELQAKAKRLARFKDELNQSVRASPNIVNPKLHSNRHEHYMERQKLFGGYPVEAAGDFTNGNVLSDHDGLESSNIIVGLCPDMCPESERAERERKGDLDQYERADGDRNQTSKFLAIKKYTRTAEREANLIRPMPILHKTVDYLLSLLDQPYDDRFLGIYNFLWDRMRAIRMDLRMQHIFNLGAITMLEQMIRLHIIAMHELCEFTKGEGFSEGFDAHLNIEQMNKTSVELFQMYDDHRKNGINIPTEREFRGYYALLKLDKHPGYKVEPAELSLDLAKMTAEIRQTSEVLFARDVARACRVGNFIAFFKLARKASYLQACLMHAHFAKLRTQALASLHSGLQSNQGLPVAHITKWLGMEQEDIGSLLEYHGFLIKEFEEPYMVKDGPVLNVDKDYPTKCSKLVHLKRSKVIIEDVSSFRQPVCPPAEERKEHQLGIVNQHDSIDIELVHSESSIPTYDEEMSDYGPISSPRDDVKRRPMLKESTVGQQNLNYQQVAETSLSPWGLSSAQNSPKSQVAAFGRVDRLNLEAQFTFSPAQSCPESQLAKVGRVDKLKTEAPPRESPNRDAHFDGGVVPLQILSSRVLQDRPPGLPFDSAVENSLHQNVVAIVKDREDDEPTYIHQETENDKFMASHHAEEAAEAKLKLIIRIWKRRASKLGDLRKQRQLAANAALNLLSLGPPLQKNKHQSSSFSEFSIDRIMRERYEKHERSWLRLNVSEVIADELSRRNPDAKCLCWKIIVCSQIDQGEKMRLQGQVTNLAAAQWLLSKVIPTQKDDVDEDVGLLISSPGLSIWKKWVHSQSTADLTCCLSIVRDTQSDSSSETVLGASAVLFLVSECIPWELQKIQLHKILLSLPSGSRVPLLILSGSGKDNDSNLSSTIINELRLHDIDKSRVSSFLVLFLVGNQQMEQFGGFFSDEQLRAGLRWLASQSLPQPVLRRMKARELVLTHLNSSLKVLDKMSIYDVGPDHCISAFNEALDRSVGEVCSAVNANSATWPCPEMVLLREFSNEYRAYYLPSMGWSSGARIEQLTHSLKDCKLPHFPEDISWLGKGSSMGKEIELLRLQLESCLVRYLTQSSKIMGLDLARKEAHVMLQTNAQLELHSLRYYIVPKWDLIFRRVFNWRLMNLSSGVPAAYVLEPHSITRTYEGLDESEIEVGVSLPYCIIRPSLDEMVEVGCVSGEDQPELEASQPLSGMVLISSEVPKVNSVNEVEGRISTHNAELAETDDAYLTSRELVSSSKTTKEADKLSKLLEQCNMLQNRIDEKLSIYF
ncbi:SAC3 family protein B isoform X2 [Malania oleifera]|uniref:SAC3 family protein B isoform X2 n=1 Tax=Malania oleifera TaxID=397392 RepID=UPI0025AE0BFC|nr:SAC3 family protein B isoform X2 [Malania oleifera]XP_057959585.1 SAC3 family protein B isoform X2 [Malania oleifera]